MAAMIKTASKTTASLSEAKNLKTGPRCQEGRAEEIVAMIGRAVSTRKAPDSTHESRSSRAKAEGSRCGSFEVPLRDPPGFRSGTTARSRRHRPPLQREIYFVQAFQRLLIGLV